MSSRSCLIRIVLGEVRVLVGLEYGSLKEGLVQGFRMVLLVEKELR